MHNLLRKYEKRRKIIERKRRRYVKGAFELRALARAVTLCYTL